MNLRPSSRSRGSAGADAGASAVEYALIVAGIALGSILVIVAFVRVATSAYDSACDKVGRGGIASAPAGCA